MYRASTCDRFIFVATGEVISYSVTFLLYTGTSHEVGEALMNYVFSKYGP